MQIPLLPLLALITLLATVAACAHVLHWLLQIRLCLWALLSGGAALAGLAARKAVADRRRGFRVRWRHGGILEYAELHQRRWHALGFDTRRQAGATEVLLGTDAAWNERPPWARTRRRAIAQRIAEACRGARVVDDDR